MKKNILIILILSSLTISAYAKEKLNVIIVSFCSTSKEYLTNEITPNIKNFLESSNYVRNVFVPLPWSNFSANLFRFFDDQKKDYVFIQNQEPNYFLIDDSKFFNPKVDTIPEATNQLIQLYKKNNRPYINFIHVRTNHRPFLVKGFENKANVIGSLNWPKKYKDYLENSKHVSELLNFMLFSVDKKLENDLYSKLYNAEYLNKWKLSPDYKIEFEILKMAYEFRLKKTDDQIKELLNFYDKNLSNKNTVLILAGDHGEAFMEHGKLHAGSEVYEEEISTFLGIKFPNSKNSKNINTTFYSKDFGKLINDIVKNKLNDSNIEKEIDRPDFIYSRNCNGTKKAVRSVDGWKLIYDLTSNEYSLFDLNTDKAELNPIKNDAKMKQMLKLMTMHNFDKDMHFVFEERCRFGSPE